MCLLAEVPLAGVLLHEVLLVAEEEMVLVVSGHLEKKEKIPLGLETLGGGIAVFSRFAWVLVLLELLIFGWLDWGASAVTPVVFADVPVC